MIPGEGLPAADRMDERFRASCGRVSRMAAAAALLAGLLHGFLWIFDRDLLWRISPHGAVMTPYACVAFVLSGIALRLGREGGGGPARDLAADACALLAASLGILSLAGLLPGAGEPDAYDLRMAPNTAVIFSLAGVSMVLGRRRIGGGIPSWMSVAAGLVALLGVMGYAFGAEPLIRLEGRKHVAFFTTATGVVLAAGILFSMEDRGPVGFLSIDRTGSRMARLGIPAMIFIPVAFGLVRHWGSDLGLYGDGVGVSLMVLFSVAALSVLMVRYAELLNRFDRERERTDRLRERHEKALAETAAVLDRVFSNIHLQIAYLDPRFNFLRVNQAYAASAGHPPEFFIGKNHFDLYPHEENEGIFRRVVETGEPFTVFSKPFEYPDRPERGTTYWDWSLQPVREGDGTVTGLIFSLVDVTERVRAEQLLRKREELSIQQEKLAVLGRMAAGIAHEVRSPLAGLAFCLGAAESACGEADELDPGVRERLVRAIASSRAATEKIGGVVRRVMDFARPGRGAMMPVDVDHAVREAVAMASPALRKGGIVLETAFSGDLPPCTGDLRLLEQLFLNLVNNAAEEVALRPSGERRIEVLSRREGEDILVSVGDSGEGIPESIREKVFEPFFTTRPEGTGLGLPICRRIASDHGGSIEIGTSRLGGAEFLVRLPAASGGGIREGDPLARRAG